MALFALKVFFVKTALIIRFTGLDDVNYTYRSVCVRAFKYLLDDIRYTMNGIWHMDYAIANPFHLRAS